MISKKGYTLLVILVLLISTSLAASSALLKSVTVDEFALLPAGLRIIENQTFDVDSGVPPLPKVLIALPAYFNGIQTPQLENGTEIPSVWELGKQFARQYHADYHAIYLQARSISIFALFATLLLSSFLAKNLYGNTGGILALLFASFSPTLLAHGRLATTDIYLTAAVVLSLFVFDIFLRKQSPLNSILLGLTIGLAILCKFTGLLLILFLPIAGVIIFFMQKRGNSINDPEITISKSTLIYGFISLVTVLLAINAGYIFQQTLRPLSSFLFQSDLLQLLKNLTPGWLPMPVPAQFILGIDTQLAETRQVIYETYLLGKFSPRGFWHYYIICLLVKLPIPFLLCMTLATILKPKITQREIPLPCWLSGLPLLHSSPLPGIKTSESAICSFSFRLRRYGSVGLNIFFPERFRKNLMSLCFSRQLLPFAVPLCLRQPSISGPITFLISTCLQAGLKTAINTCWTRILTGGKILLDLKHS
ncbi:MAG: glycosyltransferase family 39 protein [Proteobacteria bacterium]|nr:glycosyltransferase family 39 protein [Pseudomonadota bacterium]